MKKSVVNMLVLDVFELFVLGLACFRLTRLIVYDRITSFIRSPFLEEVEEITADGGQEIYLVPKKGRIRGFFGELLSCHWCTGIWSAIVLLLSYYFIPLYSQIVILILAIAGIGAIIETLVQKMIS